MPARQLAASDERRSSNGRVFPGLWISITVTLVDAATITRRRTIRSLRQRQLRRFAQARRLTDVAGRSSHHMVAAPTGHSEQLASGILSAHCIEDNMQAIVET
jgi:hypothetical protein